MHVLAVSAFLFLLACLFGSFEIEAEGKYGWGEKMPTWYRVNGPARLYVKVTNKPLTGYHAALFFVPIMVFFYPMIAAGRVTLAGSLAAVATYYAWVVVWDFSWFVLNPHYGWKQFRPNSVWWFGHEPWLAGRVPMSYVSAWVTAAALAALSGWSGGGVIHALSRQGQQFGWYALGLVLLATVGAPLFGRYYRRMRQHDERELAGIYH